MKFRISGDHRTPTRHRALVCSGGIEPSQTSPQPSPERLLIIGGVVRPARRGTGLPNQTQRRAPAREQGSGRLVQGEHGRLVLTRHTGGPAV